MNKYQNNINDIEEQLKVLHTNLSNELFFNSNDLSDTFEIENLFEKLSIEFNQYKIYIYSLNPKIKDNLFEKELLKEFIIKNDR